jgi:glutamyl-tRNA reductase
MRGKFSLDTLAKKRLLEQAKQKESSLIFTSTCNRTEIYGFAEHTFSID